MRRHYILISLIAAVLVLASCGQTGPLYLPDSEATATAEK